MDFSDKDTAINEDSVLDSPAEAADEGVQPQTDDNAESSTADDAKDERASLLDVVQNAVEKKKKESAPEESSSSDSEGEESASKKKDAKGKPGDADDFGDDSEDAQRYDQIPRFQQLKEQREKFRKERDEARQQVSSFEDKAGRWERVEGFMSESGLSGDEASQLFQFGALVKSDTPQAIQFLEGYLQDLKVATGQALPHDLQEQVDQGLVYDDAAKELSRLRLYNAEVTRQNEQFQRQQTQQQTQQAQSAVSYAVDTWEAEIASTDPDYRTVKEPLVRDKLVSLVIERGQPQTAEQGVALAREAHEAVTNHLRAMRPQRQPANPTTR